MMLVLGRKLGKIFMGFPFDWKVFCHVLVKCTSIKENCHTKQASSYSLCYAEVCN